MSLSPNDSQRLHDFYETAFKEFGESDPRSVHWVDHHNQWVRFETLLKVQDIRNKSILDVGCGLGDLYDLLQKKDIPVTYTGIDIIPEFIEGARKKYPKARFELQDIFDMDDNEHFDVVLASGALSFKVKDNEHYYQTMIKKMFDLAKEAIAFNMLDKETHVDDETFAAYYPNEISDFCQTLGGRVEVVTGYLPRDFTVYIHKS
jgi:trans-aconitate methyltransferase